MCYTNDTRLKLILLIATLLNLVPPYKSGWLKTSSTYIYYCVLIITGYICYYSYIVYEKYHVLLHNTSITLDFISITFVILQNVDAAIRSAYSKNRFYKINNLLDLVDVHLHEKQGFHRSWQFYMKLILMHVFVIVLGLFDLFTWTKVIPSDISVIFVTCLKVVQIYKMLNVVFLMSVYLHIVTKILEKINNNLKIFESNEIKTKHLLYLETYLQRTKKSKCNITDLKIAYSRLNKVMRLLNKEFGWKMFYLFGIVLMSLLEVSNSLGRFMQHPEIISNSAKTYLPYLSLLWAGTVVVSS